MVSKDQKSAKKAQNVGEQDWVAFMSRPYWVEVKVEVDIEAEVEMRLTWGWVEV